MLKTNLELNNITNVIATNAAVSVNNDTVTIYLNDDEAGHSMYVTGSKPIQVKSVSLQNVFESHNIEKCDFLKVDCEGEEYAIMNSLSASHCEKIGKICIEYHFADTKPDLLEGLIDRLESLSFKIKTRKILPDIGFLYATR